MFQRVVTVESSSLFHRGLHLYFIAVVSLILIVARNDTFMS